jgi:hypothetical protein
MRGVSLEYRRKGTSTGTIEGPPDRAASNSADQSSTAGSAAWQSTAFSISDTPAQDFDALIFFDRSTPSHLLPFN